MLETNARSCSHHISDGGFSLSVVANLFPTIVAPLKKGNLQGPPMDWVCNVRNNRFARYPCFIFVPNEYMFCQRYMFYTCFKMNTCFVKYTSFTLVLNLYNSWSNTMIYHMFYYSDYCLYLFIHLPDRRVWPTLLVLRSRSLRSELSARVGCGAMSCRFVASAMSCRHLAWHLSCVTCGVVFI